MHARRETRSSKLPMALVTVVAIAVIGFIVWQLEGVKDGPDIPDHQTLSPVEPMEAEPHVNPELEKTQQEIDALMARLDSGLGAQPDDEDSEPTEVEISEPEEPAVASSTAGRLKAVEQPPLEGSAPSMDTSDNAIRQELGKAAPEAVELLADEYIIAKTVRAMAALAEGKLVNEHRPLKNPLTPFAAEKLNQGFQISAVNAVRYKVYLDALTSIGTERLLNMYQSYYPMLDEAHKELGTDNDFRQVTIEAIDHLLAAPALSPNHVLVHPTVMYKYEDPAMENLPPAHKLMMRLGAGNRARLEPLLRNLRDGLKELP